MVEGIQVAQVEVSMYILLAPSHISSGCSKQAPWRGGKGRGEGQRVPCVSFLTKPPAG